MSTPTPLDANAVYINPSGRRCRWLPLGGIRGKWSAWAYFQYLSDRNTPASQLDPGFTLTPPNYRILRKEVAHAPAR